MPVSLPLRTCPFCGIATDVPHETQEGCIEALQAEIARVRGILQHVKIPSAEAYPNEDREPT